MSDEIDWDMVFHPELQAGYDELPDDEELFNEMLREEFGDE